MIEFGVVPLCSRIEHVDWGLRGELHRLAKTDCWEYDKKLEGSVDLCINELIINIKKYLIPFFERSYNSKKVYDEICAYEKSFRNGVVMHDYSKYCMALKFGDYALAVIIIILAKRKIRARYKEAIIICGVDSAIGTV